MGEYMDVAMGMANGGGPHGGNNNKAIEMGFNMMDSNGDGFVDFDEHYAMTAGQMGPDAPPKYLME